MPRGGTGRALVAGSAIVVLLSLVVLTATEPDRRFPGFGDPGWAGDAMVGMVAVAVVVGVVLVPALILLEAAGRAQAPRRPPGLRAWALSILGLLCPLAVALLLASTLGTPDRQDGAVVDGPSGPSSAGDAGERSAEGGTDWTVAGAVAAGLALALVAVALRRDRPLPATDVSQDAVTRDAGGVGDAIDDSLDALEREPDHRRAVVAAYARMERLFAERGVARGRAETAAREHVDRALHDLGAPPSVTTTLADQFEAARFSTRPVGADDRRAAIDAFAALRAALAGTRN